MFANDKPAELPKLSVRNRRQYRDSAVNPAKFCGLKWFDSVKSPFVMVVNVLGSSVVEACSDMWATSVTSPERITVTREMTTGKDASMMMYWFAVLVVLYELPLRPKSCACGVWMNE